MLAAVGICSATAQATPEQDAAFFEALRSVGVEPGPNAVSAAGATCGMVWSGVSPYDIAGVVAQENPGISYDQAKSFVAVSILVYCPPTQDARKIRT